MPLGSRKVASMKIGTMRELSHAARDWLRRVRKAGRELFMINRAIAAVIRLPVVISLGAVRHAPRSCRTKILPGAVRSLSTPAPAEPAEVCEINSLADFDSGYARLAEMLGHAGRNPSPGELEFLNSIAKRRTSYPGNIGPSDYLFLTAFVSILAPQRVIEIGTLTGFSAGIIAAALARRHGRDGASWVDTIDINVECAIDRIRPSGFEIPETFPELVSLIRLHVPRNATFVLQIAKRDELEVTFIDADHRHPLPLLDLLRVAPCVRRGGWIVLHDIQLGTITRKAIEAGHSVGWEGVYGAQWLFNYWPFRKISGGNIGAVQLPHEKSALVPFALRMMSIQFETVEKYARTTRRALFESLGALC
jgi:predicted O-methyltransferase YrrM